MNIHINLPPTYSDALNQVVYEGMVLKAKYDPPKETAKVIGTTEVVFRETSMKTDSTNVAANALTKTLDTTSYPDQANLTLKNDRGFDVYSTSITLDGKRIMRYSGENGELIHDSLKRDDDIRRNGEKVFEVGNEFIVDATQVANIADYWYKFLGKKKHMYAVQIPGCAYWYEVGDWYNFQVGEADTNEYIDTTVEVYAVDVEKIAGGIGTTTLLLRECEESWAKSTFYATRLATGGSPKRRVNRSNIVTVGSVDYDGTYDYKCDGVDDDAQIQAAIDYAAAQGGGTVQLTNGNFQIDNALVIKPNIILTGVGNSTILKPKDASSTTIIDFGTATGSSISDFTIDGDKANITFITANMTVINGRLLGKAHNITIRNYKFSCTTGEKTFALFYRINAVSCTASGNVLDNTGTVAYLVPFHTCTNLSSCSSSSNSTTGEDASILSFYICTNLSLCSSSSNSTTGTNAHIYSFYICTNLSSCSSSSNSTTGEDASIWSFHTCTNLSSCSSSSNSTTGEDASIDSFISCKNLTSCTSSSNSTTGVNAAIFSFFSCIRITVSSSNSNTSALSVEYGFYDCKSVQQCNSTGDSNPYTTSYADAGTANACADTSDGGYNS